MAPFLREGNLNAVIPNDQPTTDRILQTFIYRSPVIEEVMNTATQATNLRIPILISGRNGTGKKLLASHIHNKYNSQRPMVTLHCGSLYPKVFETELFGFLGDSIHNSKEGALQQADGGTLILCNVTKMPLSAYERFKKFLKTGKFTPVGSDKEISANVRIIYITSETEEERTQTEFHRQLYNCTKIISIELPELKERKEDIPDLVYHFFRTLSQSLNRKKNKKLNVTEQAMNSLKCYEWPGNTKELKEICEKIYIMSSSETVTVKDLPRHILDTNKCAVKLSYDPTLTLADINRIYILNALNHFPSKKRAAKALGITVKTLYNRLHEYGVFQDYSIQAENSL